MGIPKLMQDLLPYTERAIFSPQLELEATVNISAVVIDGPSLVYEVHRRQLKSLSRLAAPLSYRNTNEAVLDFLNEIQSHGTEIRKIYFDGALPILKRQTRLERLEQHRRELDQFNKAQVGNFLTESSPKQPARCRALFAALPSKTLHLQKALEPPFMVASAIEHLRQSVRGSLVDVIPDEAEAGCIMYASRHENVAILSNDSDVMAFPSTSDKDITLCLLDTLEQADNDTGKSVLRADCLRPSQISRRARVPSVHILAFWRFIDPNASAAVIRERTRTVLNTFHSGAWYQQFVPEYPSTLVYQVERALAELAPACRALDPRLSELRSQYWHSRHAIDKATAMHMYLPALFEDVARESPWVYGSDQRQLAYSLLNWPLPRNMKRRSLLEYQRRGDRTSGVKIGLLKKKDLLRLFNENTSTLLDTCINPGASATKALASWQKLALQVVSQRRQENGRLTPLPAMHLSACVQAVLYSFRLLKQATELISATAPTLQIIPQHVLEKLAAMPALAELMDAAQESYLTN